MGAGDFYKVARGTPGLQKKEKFTPLHRCMPPSLSLAMQYHSVQESIQASHQSESTGALTFYTAYHKSCFIKIFYFGTGSTERKFFTSF